MAQTKFKLEKEGEPLFFYYDNTTNALYDLDQTLLGLPKYPDQIWNKQFLDRYNSTSLSDTPETIKITLGHGCNYSCGYCLQKDIGNPNERPSNGMTDTLIKSINHRLKLTDVKRIELWGGETLLYWNDIVKLIEQFDNESITWYIPTNGTPLHQKHVDFFNQMKGTVAIGISHDGPGHQINRGKEFLDKKVDIFHQFNQSNRKIQYSFNPVIANNNYDLFAINDYFVDFFDRHQLKYKGLSFELARTYSESNQNSSNYVITGENIEKYRLILRKYLNAHIEQYKQHKFDDQQKLLVTSLFHTGYGVIPYAKSLARESPFVARTNCGVDDSKLLSLNIDGSVKTCQNTDQRFNVGSLMFFKQIKINHIDLNRDHHCGNCEVRRLCKSSCPLKLGQAVWDTNCAIEKTHYREIQLAAFSLLFNQQVEKAN